jgi:multiple sugar transport system substrate-binding protein
MKLAGATGISVAGLRAMAAAAQDATPAVIDASLTGEISYWHHFTSESEMAGLETGTGLFQAAYPGIKVTSENIPNADYMTQFTTAATGGGLPDTAMAAAERIPDMNALGALVDITERFGGWADKGNFAEGLLAAATIDGKLYGLPMFLFVDWVYYRKDWFAEKGINPPTTWDEFRQAAIAVTDTAAGRYGFGLRGGGGGQGHVINIMRAYGGLSVDEGGNPVIDRDKSIEAISFWSGLYTTDKVVPPSVVDDSYSQIMQAFRTGQTAMVYHHTGSLVEIMTDLTPDQVGTIPVPAGPVMAVRNVVPQYNAITNADTADLGWAWLTYWTGADAAVALLEATGYFPASTAVAADPRISGNSIYDAAVATVASGTAPISFVGFAGWSTTSVLPAFQAVLTGQSTVEEAVDQMIADLEAEIGA